MKDLPRTPVTVARIHDAYVAAHRETKPRVHLGASVLGHECERYAWLSWRWVRRSAFSGRMLRLFQTGHLEEARIVADLRRIGVEVLDTDPATGQQWRLRDPELGKHVSGSMDAVANALPDVPGWSLLEFKTMRLDAFKRLRKEGVRLAKPQHHAQMQLYMGWAELLRAGYLVVCKDNDAMHFEVVDFDARVFERLRARAKRLLRATVPPPRVSDSTMPPSPCAWCKFQDHCHEGAVADVHCRSCAHATPVVDGTNGDWMCEETGEFLSERDQFRGCDDHLFIPPLIPWAEPLDAGDGWVRYRVRGKETTFLNVAASGFPRSEDPHLTSKQIRGTVARDFDGTPEDWELFPERKAG